MIYLYLKESPLGLKYLGKTEKDPITYMGSGLHWKRHIKKYGFTYRDIKTTILFETTDKALLKEKGQYYSKIWDIVNNESFANLMNENGDGGDTSMCENFKKNLKIFRGDDNWTRNMTDAQRKAASIRMTGERNPAKRVDVKDKLRVKAIGRKASLETKRKMSQNRLGEKNSFYGKHHTDDVKSVMKEKAKGRYTLNWFIEKYGELNGKLKYEEKCASFRGKRIKPVKRNEYTCPRCNFTGKGPNMKRYHFDNCKK
jgi:hypothetical protein